MCLVLIQKLSALTRLAKSLPFKKRHILFKAFIGLQFKYCPLIWMFHGRQINDKITKLQERALRKVYHGTIASFEAFLVKDKTLLRYIIKIFNNWQSKCIKLYIIYQEKSSPFDACDHTHTCEHTRH